MVWKYAVCVSFNLKGMIGEVDVNNRWILVNGCRILLRYQAGRWSTTRISTRLDQTTLPPDWIQCLLCRPCVGKVETSGSVTLPIEVVYPSTDAAQM